MVKTEEEKAAEKAAKEQKKAEEKAAKEAAKAAEKAAKEAAAAAQPTDPITVKYRDHKGDTVERTFSKDVHGDNFAALAAEFKATNATKIVS